MAINESGLPGRDVTGTRPTTIFNLSVWAGLWCLFSVGDALSASLWSTADTVGASDCTFAASVHPHLFLTFIHSSSRPYKLDLLLNPLPILAIITLQISLLFSINSQFYLTQLLFT